MVADERRGVSMTYLLIKAALSGIIVMAVSEIARRSPGFGGLIASLPLVSILAMIWLWQDTADTERSRRSIGSDLLVCAPVATYVLGTSGHAQVRVRILARSRPFVPSNDGPLFFDDLGAFPVRNPALVNPSPCARNFTQCHAMRLRSGLSLSRVCRTAWVPDRRGRRVVAPENRYGLRLNVLRLS